MNPLRASLGSSEPICSSDDLRNIFSNLEGIYAFHVTLFESIKERYANWSPTQCLGDVFLHMVGIFFFFFFFFFDILTKTFLRLLI